MKTNSALRATLRTVVLLAIFLNAGLAWATDGNPPNRMTYQGYLTDANGEPLGNTNTGPKNYDVIFRMYTDAAGGTKLWAEQQTLTVDRGYFSVLLGEGSDSSGEPRPALNTLFTNTANASDRYIEVTVQGIGPSGGPVTIAPRLRLLTSPYAFLARNAVSANSLANAASAQIVSIVGTSIGVNTATPTSALDVNGTATATGLRVAGTAGVTSLTVTNNAAISGTLTVPTLNVSGTAGIATLRVTNNETISGALTVTGTTTSGSFVGNGTIPIGGIIMWSGSAAPAGWHLCDGAAGTPDLRNRFIVGYGSTYPINTTGGAATHTNTIAEMPGHSHAIDHHSFTFHGGVGNDHTIQLLQTGSAASPYYTGTTGSGQAYSTVPPYYALAYIMRVQ